MSCFFVFAINNCSDADVAAVKTVECRAIKAGETVSVTGARRLQGVIYTKRRRATVALGAQDVVMLLSPRAVVEEAHGNWLWHDCCLEGATVIRNEGGKRYDPPDSCKKFCIDNYTEEDELALMEVKCVGMKATKRRENYIDGVVYLTSRQTEAQAQKLLGHRAYAWEVGAAEWHSQVHSMGVIVRNEGHPPREYNQWDVAAMHRCLLQKAIRLDGIVVAPRPKDPNRILWQYLREYNTIVWPPGHQRIISTERGVEVTPPVTEMPVNSDMVYAHHSALVQRVNRVTMASMPGTNAPNRVCVLLHATAVKIMDELLARRKF